jgi:serine/threonine-protein kinase
MGSPWYMSPEQVRAVGELDARTDIYATGAVLYEMLTGRKLFDADGSFAVMRAQIEVVPQPPSAYNPEVPAALDEVVVRALAKDPTARFRSASEFRLALEAAVGRTRPSGAASNGEPASKGTKSYVIRAAAFGRASRAAILLVLASAALVAAVCAVLFWPKAARVAIKARVSRDTVVSKPAAETGPPGAVAVVGMPEVPVEAAKPALRSAVSPARSTGRASKPDQSFSTVSRGVMEPPATISPPNAAAPEKPLARAASKISTEPEAGTQTLEEGRVRRTADRFIRVLGKLNPFRKGANDESADPAEASANKD